MNSPGLKEVRPGPIAMLSTGTSRRPFGPATTQVARAAISAGTLSAAGEALQRLPASDALPCTWVEPRHVDHAGGHVAARCDNAGRIAASVDVPVIADADTGYGNELNAMGMGRNRGLVVACAGVVLLLAVTLAAY